MEANNAINSLYFSAASALSIQELTDNAWQLIKLPIIVSDSLHYVIAISPDIRERLGGAAVWSDLVDMGYAPALREGPASLPSSFFALNADGTWIAPNLLQHTTYSPDGSRLFVMCDIRHGEGVLLKLAVTAPKALDGRAQELITAFANTLYLSYFRLRYTTNALIDDRSRFLLSLLHESETSEPLMPFAGLNDFDVDGPFIIASLDTNQMDLHNLTFASVTAELLRIMQCKHLSVLDRTEYVILINTGKNGLAFWDKLKKYMQEHRLVLGVSREFGELKQAVKYHEQAKGAAACAKRLRSFYGIARYEDFELFLMFDIVAQNDEKRNLIHPAVSILTESDAAKKTDYMRTLFCWLLNSRRASVTADRLYIHRNTLDNRVARINELIQPDWNNEAFCIGMLYSLYVTLGEMGHLEYLK